MAYDEFTAKLVADNERLLAEIERLREALKRIADSTGCVDACECHMRVLNRARVALEVK